MNAEVITIGDEILIGQTIDTNSAWMAEELHLRGIRLNRIITITADLTYLHQSHTKYEISQVSLSLLTHSQERKY